MSTQAPLRSPSQAVTYIPFGASAGWSEMTIHVKLLFPPMVGSCIANMSLLDDSLRAVRLTAGPRPQTTYWLLTLLRVGMQATQPGLRLTQTWAIA